ncbi:MAG: hypothetical protein DMF96_11705 [Acidobacteria bacterium]|nr:MAG: hypothetical protein DMF96_11705 [Acidobacteriota bacterium]
MKCRILILVFCLAALIGSAAGQTKTAALRPPSTPDIQGIWNFATITPLERPADLAGKEFFTEQEAAQYEKDVLARTNMDRRLIVDPRNGRIPPLTAGAKERQAERQAANRGHEFDGPENRPLFERCLILQGAGAPTTPTAYNNNTQIVQTPGFVAIHNEMGHEVRIIPLDGRPHLPQTMRQWKGDSRGHWESDTLVVETTNFSVKNSFRGSGPDMTLTERFRRLDADTLEYRFTVDDPETFTQPWTVEIPLTRAPGPLFEYACHEGNYGMRGVLSGARAQEKDAVEAKRPSK